MRRHEAVRITLLVAGVFLALPAPSARADRAEECAQEAERASDLRDKSRWVEAQQRYQTCAVDACPRIVREDCRGALLELRQSIPRVTIRVRDPRGVDVLDGQVLVDGANASAADCANGVQVDPGLHHVEVRLRSPAGQPASITAQDLNIAASDHTRAVELVVADPAPARLPLREHASRNRSPAIAVGAIGLGFLSAFGVVGGWTLADYEHLKSSCAGRCTPDQVDPVRTRGLVADTLLGAGVAGLAVATVLWITTGEKPRPMRLGYAMAF